MERIKNLVMNAKYPEIILGLLGLRACLVDFSIGQSLSILFIASFISFREWQASKLRPDTTAELTKEVADLRSNLSGLMIKNATKPQEMQKEMNRRFF